jgi:AcrR family transcriptional regulator
VTAIRNKASRGERTSEDSYFDAARECILAVGVKRTTLTDVARRAGVSRMTLYRRWPDMHALLADLMTRDWPAMATEAVTAPPEPDSPVARQVAVAVVKTVRALRESPLFQKIVQVDPELLLPYLLERRGRSQDAMLDLLVARLTEGQRAGSVRRADAAVLARAVVLAAQGFTLSAPTMLDGRALERFDAELTLMLERYLAP